MSDFDPKFALIIPMELMCNVKYASILQNPDARRLGRLSANRISDVRLT